MNFEFTDDQLAIRAQVREFADKEIVPRVREYDEKGEPPLDIIDKMKDLGYLGGVVPEEYGGAGLDYISYGCLVEEIGRACSAMRTIISVQCSLVESPVLKWGTEEQKQKYLPKLCSGEWLGCFGLTEPNSGTDAAALRTSCRRDGDDWILNGSKMWISNGSLAQVALVLATEDPAKGYKGITAFLVDTSSPGFQANMIHGKLGLRAADTSELVFTDMRVPDACRLGPVGKGFSVALSAIENGRYSVACGCVGICQGATDTSLEYAKERQAFGRPIAGFQLVQEMIAENLVDTDAARLLVYRAGALKQAGKPNGRETSIAKYFASEAAVRCSNRAVQIYGGYGFSNEFPAERYLRDARVTTLYEGTSQVQKLLIAADATGIKAFT